MKAVYYKDQDSNSCPVKEYLSQYYIRSSDKEKLKQKKAKILLSIREKIECILEREGRALSPWFEKMTRYDFFKIKINKPPNILIRVYCFCHKKKLILLNAFEKPHYYRTSKEKRKVTKVINKTQYYMDKFLLNSTSHEDYK